MEFLYNVMRSKSGEEREGKNGLLRFIRALMGIVTKLKNSANNSSGKPWLTPFGRSGSALIP